MGDIVDFATIIGGIASVFAIFLPFFVPNLLRRKRTRAEILNLLSASNRGFSDFVANFGEPSITLKHWRAALRPMLLGLIPALVLGGVVSVVLLWPFTVGFIDLLRLVLPILVAFLSIAVALGYVTLYAARKPSRALAPSNNVLYMYYQLTIMPLYLRIFLVGCLGIFLKSISVYEAFFANTNALDLLIDDLILGSYVIMMILTIDLFYTAITGSLQRIQNQLYIHFFPRSTMLVEILLQPADSPTSDRARGFIAEIGEKLEIYRTDGFSQSIPWRDIRSIAARENSVSYYS